MKRFSTLFAVVFSLCLWVGGANAQVLVLEDFEGGSLPAGWTIQTQASDGGWNFGTADALASDYWPLPNNGSLVAATNDDACDCDKSADYLIMPAVDITGITALYLIFDMSFGGGTYGGLTEHAYIEYSTDGGSTWIQFMEIPGTGALSWVEQSIDLSALAQQNDGEVLIAFRYDDNGGWLFGFAVDNVLLYTPAALDAALASLDAVAPYAVVGDDITISGTILNNGLDTIQSLDVSWTDGTNTYTDNLTGLNLMPGAMTNFTHSVPFTVSDYESYTISVMLSNPNGSADGLPVNNSAEFSVAGLSFLPEKKVFAEEATGTWCGWCPRGAVFMEYMAETYEDSFVGVAVHNDDPMAIAAYDNGVTSFPDFTGFPSVIFERDIIIDPSDLDAYYSDYLNRGAAVQVEVTNAVLDVATRELTIEANSTFATSFNAADYSTFFAFKEDNVTGTGSGYNQANYYSGGAAGTMGGYENLPDPVPADQMVYNDVARDILPGFNGQEGIVDAAPDDVVSSQMTYDFPNNWDPREMEVVFVMLDNAHGGVALNVDASEITIICPSSLDLDVAVNGESAAGAGDGSIVVDPNVGIAPFTYLLDGVEVSDIITNLSGGDYELVVTDNAGCSDTVAVNLTVGAKDIEGLQKFAILPNPTRSQAVVDVTFHKTVALDIEVSDLTGRLVYSRHIGQTSGGQYELDLANQAEGMYLVRLKVEDQTRTQRLILMH